MKTKTIAPLLIISVVIICITFTIGQRRWTRHRLDQLVSPAEFLIDETAFPEGWIEVYPGQNRHPRANYVYQAFGFVDPVTQYPATTDQAIWRASTIRVARNKYNELLKRQYQPSRPLNPGEIFVTFVPPSNIRLPTTLADESYLACGWWVWAQCRLVSRYQQYVVYLLLTQEAEFEGHITHGLTSAEIEAVIWAMDAKFAEHLGIPTQEP